MLADCECWTTTFTRCHRPLPYRLIARTVFGSSTPHSLTCARPDLLQTRSRAAGLRGFRSPRQILLECACNLIGLPFVSQLTIIPQHGNPGITGDAMVCAGALQMSALGRR